MYRFFAGLRVVNGPPGFGASQVVGFVGVELVVVRLMVSSDVLTKSAYSLKTGSLQLCLVRSGFGRQARGVTCSR